MQKNDVVTVTIEDMSSEGQGVGHYEGFVLFVKDTVIGDVVRAKILKLKKSYGYARLEEVLAPSKDRVPAKCPVARQCGGCQLQEMRYSAQLSFKQNKVENVLKRIGGLEQGRDYEMLPIVGMEEPFHYRNKAQFPVGADRDGNLKIGFYAGRTHAIIDNMDCCIGSEKNAGILAKIKDWMKKNNITAYDEETGKGLVRHVLIRIGYHTGEICVCLVINGTTVPKQEQLIVSLCEIEGMASIMLNINREQTNVILGEECRTLFGKSYIDDYIGEVHYRISPLSFYQVNPIQTQKLYEKALEFANLTGNETVWDLYCGIGTISLFLAQRARRVFGVEIVPQAIADAKSNAKLNQMDNVEFFVGKAEEVVPAYYAERKNAASGGTASADEMLTPDVIVVDPPRKGCEEALLQTMLTMSPNRIVYVSCDPATLARDLKFLCQDGAYEVKKVQCFDCFGQGVHVEVVIQMTFCGDKRK